ncbi:MAG: DUF309 domain-containing protein [Candidatus Methylomirabilota bacterium]
MKRSVRNRLAELLLGAFEKPEIRAALAWLALFCELAAQRARPEVPLADLLAAPRAVFPDMDRTVDVALTHLIGPEKLLRLRRADTGEILSTGMPRRLEGEPWMVEPEPDARTTFTAVRERVRIYTGLLARLGPRTTSASSDPVKRAMAEAALCFNAGLFFEAHEHLEHHWAGQPKGKTKRFLQGIIQVSVGFHHAVEGNYDGAINQLAKGLEKVAGTTGEILGLDCDDFLPKVAAAREAIVTRGRAEMSPVPLSEIPRMSVRE